MLWLLAVPGFTAQRPNIIFVLTDDMGWTDLSCYGSAFYETPNIDKLASQGMKFTDAYSACTVCSPSRASILTGQYPARLHITDWIAGHEAANPKLLIPDWCKHLPIETMNLAKALKTAGYATASIGKWHLGDEAYYPEKQGFDINRGGYHKGQPPTYFSPYQITTLKDGPKGEFLSDRLTQEVISFVEKNRERPFFVYFPHYAVHTPLMAKQEVQKKYKQKAKPGDPQRHPVYAGLVESVDDSVGAVMKKLDELGLAENTIFVFTSDNGGLVRPQNNIPVTSNLPLRSGKGSAYEGGVRVPLIVRWPAKIKPGSVCATPVISADFFPTLLRAAEAPRATNPVVDGEDLMPLLTQSGGLSRTALYWHYPHYHPGGATPYSAIREGDYKLIEFFEDNHVELYDLKNDISESKDLAQAMPEKCEVLRNKLQQWRQATGAQLPTVNPHYKPKNIVMILADDLGIGDLSCYGAKQVTTPNVDRLAKEGILFRDVHSTSSTCTPTRYSILTGDYAWRKPGTGIAPGDAALLIDTNRLTLASMLKQAGYVTGAIGKWHLGMGPGPGKTDWNTEIIPGPREIGFDYSFLLPATGDRVPCVYVENQKVVGMEPSDPISVNYNIAEGNYPGEPDGIKDRATLKLDWARGHNNAIVNGIGRIGFMKGGQKARWVDEDMADVLAAKSVKFIEENKDKPFFLFFATHDIHVPRVPNARFAGKTSMGARGDVILQFDDQVRVVLTALDRLGLVDDTLVILTSDNGPILRDGYKDNDVEQLSGHRPAGQYRGQKYSMYEGGHRVPFIVRWPKGGAKGGKESQSLISLVDCVGSFAALVGQKLPEGQAVDTADMSKALVGEDMTGRKSLITEFPELALRTGKWMFIPASTNARFRPLQTKTNTGLMGDPEAFIKGEKDWGILTVDQLYDVDADPEQRNNVAGHHPERVIAMKRDLEQMVQAGGTRK